MLRLLVVVLFFASLTAYAEPRLRPEVWGKPVIGMSLDNIYRIDEGVYRSEQPEKDHISDLQALSIKEVLNLREYHNDQDEMNGSDFILHRVRMNAGKVTEEQILDALRIIKNRKGPILVHCWHGSDRTGVTIAAYRIIFNHWTKSQALDEMIHGGYGYHASIYPNLVTLVNELDIDKIKNALDITSQ